MPQVFEHKPQARLALSRAKRGLVRARNGWAADEAQSDPRDLISFRTINALAERGLIVIAPCGSRATLAQSANAH